MRKQGHIGKLEGADLPIKNVGCRDERGGSASGDDGDDGGTNGCDGNGGVA